MRHQAKGMRREDLQMLVFFQKNNANIDFFTNLALQSET
jgi:hypothetical protein